MGITSWIVGNHINSTFEDIEAYAKEKGINLDFDGAGDLADFAVELKDTMADKDQEISMRVGSSLRDTFEKAVGYSLTAAGLDSIKIKRQEAVDSGDQELVSELSEQVENMEEQLKDLEEDILDDYRNLEDNVDIEAMHVQRNYDPSGNVSGVEVSVNIKNENNGDIVEMKTEIDVNDGQINKVNIGFDM
tara:strand:+ start:148312 stop:148881 length:570 start_codon:yes stop_codon:yes gene_type:complete